MLQAAREARRKAEADALIARTLREGADPLRALDSHNLLMVTVDERRGQLAEREEKEARQKQYDDYYSQQWEQVGRGMQLGRSRPPVPGRLQEPVLVLISPLTPRSDRCRLPLPTPHPLPLRVSAGEQHCPPSSLSRAPCNPALRPASLAPLQDRLRKVARYEKDKEEERLRNEETVRMLDEQLRLLELRKQNERDEAEDETRRQVPPGRKGGLGSSAVGFSCPCPWPLWDTYTHLVDGSPALSFWTGGTAAAAALRPLLPLIMAASHLPC